MSTGLPKVVFMVETTANKDRRIYSDLDKAYDAIEKMTLQIHDAASVKKREVDGGTLDPVSETSVVFVRPTREEIKEDIAIRTKNGFLGGWPSGSWTIGCWCSRPRSSRLISLPTPDEVAHIHMEPLDPPGGFREYTTYSYSEKSEIGHLFWANESHRRQMLELRLEKSQEEPKQVQEVG